MNARAFFDLVTNINSKIMKRNFKYMIKKAVVKLNDALELLLSATLIYALGKLTIIVLSPNPPRQEVQARFVFALIVVFLDIIYYFITDFFTINWRRWRRRWLAKLKAQKNAEEPRTAAENSKLAAAIIQAEIEKGMAGFWGGIEIPQRQMSKEGTDKIETLKDKKKKQ